MNENETSASKKIWIITGLAILILLGAGIWIGRPAYRRFMETRRLTQAREFVKKSDYRNATLALRQTLALNPANFEATRLMAELAGEAQSPVALPLWRRVVELSPTFDNKILLAAIALRIEKPPFPIAAQTLEELQPVGETNTAYHLAASQLAIKLNRIADAEAHLQAAARLQPTNRLHLLNLATIRLQARDPATADAARQELTALITDGTAGQHALRSLVADALLRQHTNEGLRYSQQLVASTGATFADRLQYLTVLQMANSPELPAQLARVQEETSSNSLLITQTLSWMSGHGLAREALTWLATLPEATRNAMPVPLAESDCYLVVRDWPGLAARLGAQQWDEQEFIRLALLARALREQNQNEVADVVWRRAVGAASARPGFTAALSQVALGWGWKTEADDLLWLAAKKEPTADWPLQTLGRIYSAAGNTAGLYRVQQAMLERHPQSNELKNNVAMFALLLNQDSSRTMALAREVYEAGKTNAIFVSTYAFALHLQGKSAEAMALMQALPEPELKRPEIAVYYAMLLTATGDREKAKPYVVAAETGRLLPEERRLLDAAR